MLTKLSTKSLLIFSGESACGKSYTAQMLIKEFMYLSCGPSQTDLVKVVTVEELNHTFESLLAYTERIICLNLEWK